MTGARNPADHPWPFRLHYGSGSHQGLRRELNEDSLAATGNLFAVADGMGGHEAGEVASRVCVETLAAGAEAVETALTVEDVQELMARSDEAIRQVGGCRAGTTLAGAAIVCQDGDPDHEQAQGLRWLVFNVGDSRTYRLSGGGLEQVSVDHSEVQELVDRGHLTRAQAQVHPRRHVITRALGTGGPVVADIWMRPVVPGDRLMVCSDGLTTEVGDDVIAEELASRRTPQQVVDALIQHALTNGGRDNVTVVVVDVADG